MKYLLTAGGLVISGLLVASPVFAGVNTWTATGPPGGSVAAVRYLPGNGRVALAVTRYAIYRSTDDGANWTSVQRFAAASDQYRRCSVAVNPQNGNQVLVVADSLYRSTDRGLTWTTTPVAGLTGSALAPRCVKFTNNGVAAWLGATQSRVYRSGDSGATWTLLNEGFPTISGVPISQLEVDATNADVVYARSDSTMRRTLNDGALWNLMGFQGDLTEVVASRFTSGTLLRTQSFPGQPTERSIDSGDTWGVSSVDRIYGITYSLSTPGRAIGFDPAPGNIRITQNDGQSWSVLAPLPMQRSLDFAFDPAGDDRLLMAHNGGVFASGDGGLTWAQRNAGLAEANLPMLYATANSVYASASDFAGVYRRNLTTGVWQAAANTAAAVLGPSDGWNALAVSPQNSEHLFMARDNDFGQSMDGGATWTRVSTFPSLAQSLYWDPSSELVGYAITTSAGLMKTVDGGVNWTTLGNTSSSGIDLVIDPANANNLYLATYGGNGSSIWRSTDAGLNWSISPSVTTAVGSIVFKPGNPAVLYAAATDGIYTTSDRGVTWAPLTTLPAGFQPNKLAVDRNAPDIIYALDARGPGSATMRVIRSVDSGATWETLNFRDAYGNTDARALAVISGERSTLVVSRQDAGLYEMRIAPDLRLTATGSGSSASTPASVALTVTNAGSFSATSVRVTSELPTASGSYTATASAGTCAVTVRQLSCDLGTMRPAGTASVTLGFTPAAQGNWQAAVAAYEPDSNSANDTVDLVVGPAVVAPPAPPAPPSGGGGGGGRLDYLLLGLLGALTMRGVVRRH